MHRGISDRAVRPNQCLPWIMLSIEDSIKVLQDSKVFCKFCLRFQGIGATSSFCGKGKHIAGNGRNNSCIRTDCENNVTLCKKHENFNLKSHGAYKDAMKWKQSVSSGGGQVDEEEETYLMTATEETDNKGAAVLDNMIVTRKEIHLKQGMDIAIYSDIKALEYPRVLKVKQIR